MILQEDLDFLSHYGVPGMKWGKRQAAGIRRNHELNKASRLKDKTTPTKFKEKKPEPPFLSKEHKQAVDKARADIKSGKAKHELKNAKIRYRKDRAVIGSREAKKILRESKDKYYSTVKKASEDRDILEFVSTTIRKANQEAEARNRAQLRKLQNAQNSRP